MLCSTMHEIVRYEVNRMRLCFIEPIYTQGNRAFVEIPFNVWEETGLKGNIPSKTSILNTVYECKLIPKGGGKYLLPIPKTILSQLEVGKDYEISIEPIESLSRINHNSPYSTAHPIREIDSINVIPIQSGYCGHCCVAMLAGVSLSEAISLMGKGHASWSKILEALDYYGISYSHKAVYTKGKPCLLPPCCIVNNDNSFLLWHKNSFYGVTNVDPRKTISYIEVFTH